MEIAVPTLSVDGFATDIRKQADALVAYYFASDHSQSNVFMGRVISIAYHIQQHGHDTFTLKQEMERDLQAYLERHFDSATVTITIEETADSSQYNINFDAMVTKGNTRYSVGRLVEIQNQRVVNIIDIMRTGS